MNNPLISVIVPVYRAEAFLRRCLDSIVNQTYANLEIILVDDGSPDQSGLICDEYAGKDSRIIVIHKENGGVASARNTGLAIAKGEWIGWVDADDWIEPDMFEYLLCLAQTHNSDISQCGLLIEEDGSCCQQFTAIKETVFSDDTASWRMLSSHVWNKLYRAEVVRDIMYDGAYPIGEDLLFNVGATARTLKIAFGSQAKYHYIQHEESICHKSPTPQTLLSARRVLLHAVKVFEADPVAKEHFYEELYRNDLDICSRIVRFYKPEFATIKKEIQHNYRANMMHIQKSEGFSLQERIKFLLIAWAWPIYRKLLLTKKKISM